MKPIPAKRRFTRYIPWLFIGLSILITGCGDRGSTGSVESTALSGPQAQEVDAFGMVMLTPEQIAALKANALTGDPEAMTLAIDTFTLGIGVQIDELEAYRIAEQGAAMGVLDAKAALGHALMSSTAPGIPRDEEKGRKLLEEAAEAGNERAARTLAQKLPPKEQANRLSESYSQYGIKDARTAATAARACLIMATAPSIAEEESRKSLECAQTWLRRAQSAPINRHHGGITLLNFMMAELAESKGMSGFGDAGALLESGVNLNSESIADARFIAMLLIYRAQSALNGTHLPKNAEAAKTYALRATNIEAISSSDSRLSILQDAYIALWTMHSPHGKDSYFPDKKRAYGWALLAKSATETKAWENSGNEKLLQVLELTLSAGDRLQVQKAIAARKPGEDIHLLTESSEKAPAEVGTTYGTAFLISDDGFALTNAHVVKNCKTLKDKDGAAASVVAVDDANDLASIRFGSYTKKTFGLFEASSRLPRVGDRVVVFGFPLSEVLATTGNLTAGEVSASAGLGNNSSMFQISAPIQPGSSGSPVLSLRGNVAGVISSTASTVRLTAA